MSEEKSIEDEIRDALMASNANDTETTAADDTVEEIVETTPDAEELDNEVSNEEKTTTEPAKTVEPPPVGLTGAIKAKWHELPDDVRAEWKKREDDIHRMMTAKEGELNLGRSVKEIATPYEAIIRAEGGTIEGAFRDLMNTAYVLRTGTPQQKLNLILQTAQQFNIPLGNLQQQQQENPLMSIQQELQMLKEQANPERIKMQLQDEMERDRVRDEITAFAANPEHVHFEAVKSVMGTLISSGRAKNLQEAYDMAVWSDPSIRSEMLKAQQAKEAEKKKAEMVAKKKAAASVSGSPGLTSPNTNAPQTNLEDEIRKNMRALSGKI